MPVDNQGRKARDRMNQQPQQIMVMPCLDAYIVERLREADRIIRYRSMKLMELEDKLRKTQEHLGEALIELDINKRNIPNG